MRTLTKREPIRARSAWKPSDFPTPAAYSFTLTEAHLAAFDAAIAASRRTSCCTAAAKRSHWVSGSGPASSRAATGLSPVRANSTARWRNSTTVWS